MSYRMPRVAAMVIGPGEQELVAEQLAGVASVAFCDSLETLEQVVLGGGVQAVLTDLWDRTGARALPTLLSLRQRAPDVPLVACFRPTADALQEVFNLMAARAEIGTLLRGLEHIGLAVRRLVGPPPPPDAAEVLVQRIVPAAPPSLASFFTICALRASPRLRVSTAASWIRMSRRTIERRLSEEALPTAATVVGSMTCLHAAWWLDVQGRSSKQVVREMGFPHTSSLTRLLQRRFDCTISSLRGEGGFPGLLHRFEASLREKSHAN